MKKWQKYWLYLVLVYAGVHLLRDVFQDLGIKNWLSTVLVKTGQSKIIYSYYWGVFNTYIIALLEILLAVTCLKRWKFGRIGLLTIIIADILFFAWFFYLFFM